jgi:hypothetical protein
LPSEGASFRSRIPTIVEGIGDRELVWFGTRASDALPLKQFGSARTIVSQIAPLLGTAAIGFSQSSLETELGQRGDLDRYDIDLDQSPEAKALKRRFVSRTTGRKIVVAYRPAEFLSALEFCDSDVVAAFNFHLLQRQLEHKPWTDTLLRRLDSSIPLLPTFNVRDTDIDQVGRLLERGKLVGRTTRSSGGSGVFLVKEVADFIERIPPHRDEFLTVSPLLSNAIPLNVNACVYADGNVRLFGVSFQLLGVPGLTRRAFGFCGNDFAAATSLPSGDLAVIENVSLRVGACLARIAYRGVFGIDFLLGSTGVFIAEINPRFQASTALCSHINQALEIPDPCTEHIAAFLDLAPPPAISMVEWARLTSSLPDTIPFAQLFHRNVLHHRIRVVSAPDSFDNFLIDGLPDQSIWVDRDAMMFRSIHRQSITEDGYTLRNPLDDALKTVPIGTSVSRP